MAASMLLLYFLYTGRADMFRWFLVLSFFTDLIDGLLARKYKVTSVLGSKLDSVADDLTFLMAAIGVFVWKFEFIRQEYLPIIGLLGLYVLQTIMALVRYGKISSFHTYLAKCAALLQGTFLILLFFLTEPPFTLFYIAAAVTALDLIEEIIIVIMEPEWQSDVKGIYWMYGKSKRKQ
jgi:CDP-diacylglycerol--glycerol-3-phosphate 3-phosphatidyltransferase